MTDIWVVRRQTVKYTKARENGSVHNVPTNQRIGCIISLGEVQRALASGRNEKLLVPRYRATHKCYYCCLNAWGIRLAKGGSS